jgi:hypothetical protein
VERLFTSANIRKFAANGPLIALQVNQAAEKSIKGKGKIYFFQFAGPNCLKKAQEVSIGIIHETGGSPGCVHCSQNRQEAKLEISNLFNFADMQLGI